MTDTERIVAGLRQRGAETTAIEVKSAAKGAPKSVRESLSALANGGGGVILLGLDEDRNFTPAPGFDAKNVRDALAGMASSERGLVHQIR